MIEKDLGILKRKKRSLDQRKSKKYHDISGISTQKWICGRTTQ